MHIGILETGHAPDGLRDAHGSYPEMFARLLAGRGFTFSSYAVVDGQFPDTVTDAEGWLMTGSRHGAYDPLEFIPRLETFVRDAYAACVPQVGICFGHQVIAQALGGRVEKFAGGWVVGAQLYDFEGGAVRLNAWHQDQVTAVPGGARVVAANPGCRYAALRYGDLAYTVQAHPEYSDGFIEGLLDTRAPGVVPEAQQTAARASLGHGTDAGAIATRIAEFLRQPRRRA